MAVKLRIVKENWRNKGRKINKRPIALIKNRYFHVLLHFQLSRQIMNGTEWGIVTKNRIGRKQTTASRVSQESQRRNAKNRLWT